MNARPFGLRYMVRPSLPDLSRLKRGAVTRNLGLESLTDKPKTRSRAGT